MRNKGRWTQTDAETALLDIVRQGNRGEELKCYFERYGAALATITERKDFARFYDAVERTLRTLTLPVSLHQGGK